MADLRVGVVGCGAIGRDHIRRINEAIPGAVVTAVADVVVEAGTKVADQWNCKFFQDGVEMIHSGLVDAIIVATLDQFHEQYVIAAIEAGIYVFCEKPLAPDAAACRRIMDAEIKAGKRYLQVGFMRRYDEGYKALKEIITTKKYGEPLVIHAAHRNAFIAPYYVTDMLISNCAVHEIDVLRWLLGEDYKTCQVVKARCSSNSWEGLNDPIIILLETKSGVRIDVEVFANCKYGYDIRTEVVCENASVSLPTPTGVMIRSEGLRGIPVSSDWQVRFIDSYDVEFREWVDGCKNGGVFPGPSAWDGYACAVGVTACVKALAEGTIEPIELGECPDFYKK